MLIAAAVCPHPPLLIPEVTGDPGPAATGPAAIGPVAAGPELARLRAASQRALSALVAERPDLVAVVGADPRAAPTAEYPPDTPGHLHDFGVPFIEASSPPPAPPSAAGLAAPSLPLSLTVGRWLLSRVAQGHPPTPAVWWGIAPDASPAQARHLGETLAALAPRVALLALGDGPGRRARAAPEAADPAADRYDDQVAAALAAAEPAALAALDPGQDGPLVIAGRAAWQALAGAAGQGRFTAVLHYRGVPFEVSYYMASWRRAP
jgi:hypothetical protein